MVEYVSFLKIYGSTNKKIVLLLTYVGKWQHLMNDHLITWLAIKFVI